jgi:hypothetical protein
MTTKKINELNVCDKDNISSLIGIDNENNVKKIPLNLLRKDNITRWAYIPIIDSFVDTNDSNTNIICQIDMSAFEKEYDKCHGGILHIFCDTIALANLGCKNVEHFEIMVNDLTFEDISTDMGIQQIKLVCTLIDDDTHFVSTAACIRSFESDDGTVVNVEVIFEKGNVPADIMNIFFEPISDINNNNTMFTEEI